MSIEHGFQTSLTVSLVVLAVVASAQSRIVYVDDDATGANDGTSWDNAYVHLQDALADANDSPTPVEIRVAQGIYKPDGSSVYPDRRGDRHATFALVDGTTLFGGYAGNDAVDPNARDIGAYRTVLTGDLADNDAPVADPWGSLEDDPSRTDNSFRVVTVDGADPNTLLAGLIITGAYEYAAGAPLERPEDASGLWVERGTRITVQGCIFSENVAPGIHCSEGSEVTVADCVFADNVTTGPGGGMITYGRNVDIVRCTFERNRAWSGGGGVYHYDYYGYLRLEDCAFRYNATWWGGPHITVGGIFGDVGGALCSGSAAELIGCEFRGNSAGSGGAVRPGGNSTFTNCTFYDNRASVGGGAMILQGRISNVTGCIFSGNIAAAGGAVCQELGEARFTACLFSGNSGTDRGGGAVRIDDSPPRGTLSMSIRPASTTRMPIRPTSAEFSNCTFVGNIAPEGRAIWFKTATSAKTEAGAIVLSNCITDGDRDEIHCEDTQATIAYTNLHGGLDTVYDPGDSISWGPGNIDADPLFAAPGYWDPNGTPDDPKDDFWVDGDYHLKSEAGRWNPIGETWVRDDVTSPCIDAGDPNSPVAFEPFPNGGVINMGTYGGTAEASKSSSGPHAQYGGGIGEPNDPYLIYTAEHINALGAEPNDYDKHFKLMADIDLSGYSYETALIASDIAPDESGFQGVSFTGSFDGSNHMISNLHIEGGSYLGLFGQLGPEAMVFNLDLEAVDVSAMGDYVGGLAGQNLGNITSSNNAVADGGHVSGRDSVGGLVGSNGGGITQCHSSAAVSARYDVGGLVGFNSGDVTYCSNTGEVSGDSSVGGLVGHSFRGSRVNGCSNEGAVMGRVSIGGLVGRNFETSDVRNCYSHGNVSGIRYVGGLMGMNTFIAYAVNCYSTGAVSGNEEVGGLVGWSRDPGDLFHCFWDTQTSGQSKSGGGTGKTTTEMQTAGTFLEAGWDFSDEIENGTDDIWWISEDQDYPRLWWEFLLVDKIVLEANYILTCQCMDSRRDAYGAINNVYPGDGFTWIVPRENAMAILGLLLTTTYSGDQIYQQRAELAMDYLVSVQDQSDGAWADQYSHGDIHTGSESPTQTAEVMIAMNALSYDEDRYASMKKGAEYLLLCQDNGYGGLLCGGKNAGGAFYEHCWTSDNSYAYRALKAAQQWALIKNDFSFATQCGMSAETIIRGINDYLRATPVWHQKIDGSGRPDNGRQYDWINYAPQMLDLPADGVNEPAVGEWIHRTFQQANGACIGPDTEKVYPGLSFQASLCWLDLGQTDYASNAIAWSESSGLWQRIPDSHGIAGGWVDWQRVSDPSKRADEWERFIDTSFYAIAAWTGGYDFHGSSSP